MAEVLSLPENKLASGQEDRLKRVANEYWLIGAMVVPDAVYVKDHLYCYKPAVWDIAWLKKDAKKRKLWHK